MRRLSVQIALALMMVWSLGAVASLLTAGDPPEAIQQDPCETEAAALPRQQLTVNVLVDSRPVTMALEDYLTGVLISEVPAEFHMEAKKAQAVAARTFTLASYRHGTCAVCNDPGCCQGYLTDETYFRYGGTEEGIALARKAVQETAEMVLTYDGVLIEATYFSCSGGRTEDAMAVWGTDIPYLQAVDSPGEEQAAFYTDSVRFSAAEFQNKLGVSLFGSPGEWFGAVSYTEGGGVEKIEIGGTVYSGNDLRFRLGLRSTAFTVTTLSDSVIITTRGFGHRVGLSQYGAEAMARAGSSFQEILSHYYVGTSLVDYEKDEHCSSFHIYTVNWVRERICAWNSGSSSQK